MTTAYIDPEYLKIHLQGNEQTYSDIMDRIVNVFSLRDHFTQEELDLTLYGCYFIPSSAIILNTDDKILKTGAKRDIFSCYQYELEDDIISIANAHKHAVLLTAAGGGIGADFSKLSSSKQHHKTNGVIPFAISYSTVTRACRQADTKSGSCAIYLDIEHDEIDEFLELHVLKGDSDLRLSNGFTGVKISDKFMLKVAEDYIHDQSSKEFQRFIKLIKVRAEHGRPYIFFTDNVLRGRSEAYKDLDVRFSNLCTEIMLNTVPNKASVCCLSSFHFDRLMTLPIEQREISIRKGVEILSLIYKKASQVKRNREDSCLLHYDNSIGIGVFGYADYIDRINLEFNDPKAMKDLTDVLDIANEHGLKLGMRQVTAIPPTERISRIFGASQNIELYNNRNYVQKDDCGNNSKVITHKKISSDYSMKDKILFTAEIQKHVHQGISLTLFYPNNEEKLVSKMASDVVTAWKNGIKTLYYVKANSEVVTNKIYQPEVQDEPITSCYVSSCGKCGG